MMKHGNLKRPSTFRMPEYPPHYVQQSLPYSAPRHCPFKRQPACQIAYAFPQCFPERKHTGLPYKWPLLADGQNETSLEARVAFHLHRLRLSGAPLRTALKSKMMLSTAISQARLTLNDVFILQLAVSLRVAPQELTRQLSQDETNEWAFYRASALNDATWKIMRDTWQQRGLSHKTAAAIISLSPSHLSEIISGKRTRVLSRTDARLLLAATHPGVTPEDWLQMAMKHSPESAVGR